MSSRRGREVDQFLARASVQSEYFPPCNRSSGQTLDVNQGPGTTKSAEELKATAAEMERTALKAVINLFKVSQLVDLSHMLEHRVVEEYVALYNSNGTYREVQKSKLIQKHFISLCAICRSAGTLYHSRWHEHDLEDDNSTSRSTYARRQPTQAVGLRPQGVSHQPIAVRLQHGS